MPRPGLLVSVRSASEARDAFLGGASVLDVKEPSRGPLGCSDEAVWRGIREAVPARVPVSVALGELRDWLDRPPPPSGAFEGIAFRKLGLSGMRGLDWPGLWGSLRARFGEGPAWVAVAYLDADLAGSPEPGAVRDVALMVPGCAGVLLDTWDKARPSAYDALGPSWFGPLRAAGLRVALAGGLDERSIRQLARSAIAPDLLAVRGAACAGGDRLASVERDRVRRLVEAIAPAGAEEARRGEVASSG